MSEHLADFLAAPQLVGPNVRLELVSLSHVEGLLKHGSDREIFQFLPCAAFRDAGDVKVFINRALDEFHARERIPYAIVDLQSGEAVGSSSFLALREQHRSVEIGWTWIGVKHQRTALNRICKLLLLSRAFEEMHCKRVEFKTDLRNIKSQRAIERIGAQREGVLRKHMICADGYERDSVYYSITYEEWPEVRARLEGRLL